MRDKSYTAAADFLKRLFGETLQKVELRACANERTGAAHSIFGRDEAAWKTFCRQQDREGMGVYFGVCTRGGRLNDKGAISGAKDNVLECPALWVDIDCAKQGIPGQEALNALAFLPFPPSVVINSGGGLHAYWVLEEAIDLSGGYAVVEDALRALAGVLAGDRSVAEIARIMRLPGTHNTKPATIALCDGPALVEVIEDTGRVYDFEQIADWLSEQRAVLHSKVVELRPVREDDPFAAYARQAGYEPAIDVEAELAAMSHGGGGDTSIHRTQLRVSMSMIARGYSDDEIVDRVLAATEAAAPGDAHWNWAREEAGIRKMVESGRKLAAKDDRRDRAPAASPPASAGATALKLVHDADKAEKPKRKQAESADESRSQTVAVGKAVIGVWQDRYGPIVHVHGQTYSYEGGIWRIFDDSLAQRLRAMIQEACASLRIEPKTAILNAARAYFMDRPELHRDDVEFDRHRLLIAEDAALRLDTLEIVAHSPDHFALFKVAARLHGERACPTWLGFLRDAFSDRESAAAIIATLQEWFGSSVAITRSRPLLKGLLAHGPSRSGKTQVSRVMRAILGERHVCNARMRDLEGRFGMEPLIGKRGWIADDAIGAKEYLDAETYKVVVTGEDTSAQMKGGKNWEGSFGFPVLLTANNLPRVNDKSDATYNRSIILPMTVVRPEGAPEPKGYESIAAKIIAEELTGVLWWAIEGRHRLFARGRFDLPTLMMEAGRSLQDSNDPIGSWIRQCVEVDASTKVARKDLATSFNGWWEMESDDGKPFNANSITRRVVESFPACDNTLKSNGERMIGGVRINEEGLFAWESRARSAGSAYSSLREDVNRFLDIRPLHRAREESAPASKQDLGKTRF